MIRQICSIKPEDVATVRSSELLAKVELEDLDLILRERMLHWFGHVERSSGAVRTACDIQIDGRRGQMGWSDTLLVAHTTLLEISCRGSLLFV